MESWLHQSNTESYEPNRDEGLSPDISSSDSVIETQHLYNKHQSGYCKNHSNATILSKLCDDIQMALKQSELTMAVFIDY